ncbi:hypothetical protein LXL04_019982 [Taraxacum kok-saghyz]
MRICGAPMMQRSGHGVAIDPPALPLSPPGVVFESVPVVHGKAADDDDQDHDYDHLVGDLISHTTACTTTNSIPMGHNYHHDQ